MTVSVTGLNPPALAQPRLVRRERWIFLGILAAVSVVAYGAGALTSRASSEPASPAPAHSPPDPGRGVQPVPAAVAIDDVVVIDEEGAVDDAPPAESEPSPSTGSEFYVQVASYRSEVDAAEYAASLSARGLPAQALADPSGSSWHWVRLGPYSSRVDAEKGRFALKLQERDKAHVLPRSNGKYHVQVGSFATREQAEPVAKRLEAAGHVTKISRIKMGDRRWYCVRIGPFDNAQEAADYQQLVTGEGPTAVIPYPPPQP